MAKVTFKGSPIHIHGSLPSLNSKAPEFTLVDKDLHNRTLKDYSGKLKMIAVVPSLDTGVCSKMTKHLNDFAKQHPNAMIITVSTDLPFAQKRFCEEQGVENVVILSMMRDKNFGRDYGLLIEDGPLAGVLARALLILDEKDHLIYVELVPEITQEPDYEKALKHLTKK